jgi:glutaredoxin
LGEIILAIEAPATQSDELTVRQWIVYLRPPMQLKFYSREWCSWCIGAKDYRFQEIDVGRDRQAYEEMKQLSAQTYVPTFVAGDKVLANFDTNQLQKFLNEHQINP